MTVDQLLAEKALWIPSLDVYVTAGDAPLPFDDHLRALAPRKGQRVLDRLRAEPEATYADYTAKWEDMGSPAYSNPQTRGPGHIVGLTWDSAIRKFGDRPRRRRVERRGQPRQVPVLVRDSARWARASDAHGRASG